MTEIIDQGLENVAEELKQQRVHVVCVAAGGLTMVDHFATYVGKLDQREEVWPVTLESNQLGVPRTFWPRLSLTAVPLPEWEKRCHAPDIEHIYRVCFEGVAKINRNDIRISILHIDLNGWGSRYHFKLARQVAETILSQEDTIQQIYFEPEARGCRDTHL